MTNGRLVHIVDDDIAVLHATAFMLQHAGFQVREFESGAAFLKNAEKSDRSCVLLDMRMAEMDGAAVQHRMIEKGMDMPVIILTGQGDIETAARSMRLGAVNFLEKPYKKESLLAALQEAFALLENKDFRLQAAEQARRRLASLLGPEQDVLEELMKGCSNKAIASNLGISLHAVDVFRANLIEKLRVNNILQALRIGFAASGLTIPAQPLAQKRPVAATGRIRPIRRSARPLSSGYRPRAT